MLASVDFNSPHTASVSVPYSVNTFNGNLKFKIPVLISGHNLKPDITEGFIMEVITEDSQIKVANSMTQVAL
jgi:hypothetical protein